MATPQRQYRTLEDQLGSNSIRAEGLLVVSDYHGHSDVLENSLDYATKNNLAVAVNGDAVNDYMFPQLAEELGYQSPQRIQLEFLYNKTQEEGSQFGENDLQTYMFLRNLSQTGGDIDPFLEQVPESQRDEARQTLEEILKYGQSDMFRRKIENVSQEFFDKEMPKVQENVMGMQALYQVFMDEEAKRFAQDLNKYSDTSVLFNLGNHENAYFVDQVRQYLDNPNQIVDITNTKGHIGVRNSKGEELSIAGMTNCAQLMPYAQEIFGPEDLIHLYDHMKIGQTQENELVLENLSGKEIRQDQVVPIDRDYQRIKEGNDKELDVFFTHGQIGEPQLSGGRKGYSVPYYKSAAALSLESKLTVEGHIHGEFDGENSLGKRMIRATGENAAIIKKENGEVVVDDWVQVNPTFDGNHNNEIPYEIGYLQSRVDEVLKIYEAQMQQIEAANDENYEGKKAA